MLVNYKPKNWKQFLFISEFAYNNAKNLNIRHITLKLNYGYHFCVSHKKNIDSWLKFKLAKKL